MPYGDSVAIIRGVSHRVSLRTVLQARTIRAIEPATYHMNEVDTLSGIEHISVGATTLTSLPRRPPHLPHRCVYQAA